jgi:hypothetical protein
MALDNISQKSLQKISNWKFRFLDYTSRLFQQERDNAHIHDAVFICPGLRVAIHDDNLAEEVARVPQREGLLRPLCLSPSN